MPQGDILARLLAKNAQWAQEVEAADPGFFLMSATEKQAPKVLWIGCSDSRVPESVVTASRPGDIFVHRNIANQFHPYDDSALAVLEYAITDIKVSHVVVVGHTNCGGVEAARRDPPPSLPPSLERWLAPLTELAREVPQTDDLVEVNVRAQVANIARTDVMRDAWAAGEDVRVHGWVYDLETGRLRDLGVSVGKAGEV